MPRRIAAYAAAALSLTALASGAPASAQGVPDTMVCTVATLMQCEGKTCKPLSFGNRTIRLSMTDRTACVRTGSSTACTQTWKFEIARSDNRAAIIVFPDQVQLFHISADGTLRGADLDDKADYTFRGTCKPSS